MGRKGQKDTRASKRVSGGVNWAFRRDAGTSEAEAAGDGRVDGWTGPDEKRLGGDLTGWQRQRQREARGTAAEAVAVQQASRKKEDEGAGGLDWNWSCLGPDLVAQVRSVVPSRPGLAWGEAKVCAAAAAGVGQGGAPRWGSGRSSQPGGCPVCWGLEPRGPATSAEWRAGH